MHIKVMGQGPDLVLLHGWSMHSAVWHQLAEQLAKTFTLHLVDLPGHGYSAWRENGFELTSLVDELAAKLPEHADWMGWSLGGLISLAFASRYATRVNKLILLAATPCFVKTQGWDNAMEPSVFQAFADNLNENQQQTLQRFLMLQARGSSHSRETIRELSEQLAQEAPAKPEALHAGLAVLINEDKRDELSDIHCPVLAILGERDTLIPVTVSENLKQLNPAISIHRISGAGHAPFISHLTECHTSIEQFLHE
jgi:pimeloyl-[acyl-carrier protein] methyl ester esterase